MNLNKGSICTLKISEDRLMPICIISKMDNDYMVITGKTMGLNFDDKVLTYYFGIKYLNSKVDLLNSSSWNDKNYNGVRYNVILMPIQLLETNSKFIKKVNIDDFYPMGGKRTIKKLDEINKIIAYQENDFEADYRWGYKEGFYNIFINYKK